MHDLYTVVDGKNVNNLDNEIFYKLIQVIYNLILYIVGYYEAV